MKHLAAVLVVGLGLGALFAIVAAPVTASHASAQALTRRYWLVPIDSLAVGRAKHTHVEVRGRVSAVRQEDDGDLHIVLQSLTSPTFIVGECIPSLPCQRPRVGDTIRLRGISRRDPEHPWNEVHPVEALLH